MRVAQGLAIHLSLMTFLGASTVHSQQNIVPESIITDVLMEITGLSIEDISDYQARQSGGRITLNYFTKYFQSSELVCRRSQYRIFANVDGRNEEISHEFMGYEFALGTCQERMDWHGMGTVHFNDKFLIYILDKTEEWLSDESIDREFKATQIDGHFPLFENLSYIELIPNEGESDNIIKFTFFKLFEDSEYATGFLGAFITFKVTSNGRLIPIKYDEDTLVGHKVQK